MQGLTELLFRRAYQRCFPGAFDYAVSPFLSLTHGNLKDAGKMVEDVLPEANKGSMPVVPQILGHEAEQFVDLANRLYELGYNEVNWNMGCPMRRVAHKHRGSGILPFPDEVHALLDHVVPRIRPALSIKLRLGYYSPDEIDRIIPILNDFPMKNITVHPRIGKQMYSGQPNLAKLAEILPSIRQKVIYNGDICRPGDYGRIRSLFPTVKEVMIGRGALYNPLLPTLIRQQFPEDFAVTDDDAGGNVPTAQCFIRSLMDDIMQTELSRQAKSRKMKEYWCLLSKALPGTEQEKRKVLHAEDLDAILSLIFCMTK